MEIKQIDPLSQVMITPSEVIEYLFCPRFTYFLNVLKIKQYEEKRYKVQKGRRVHEDRLRNNKQYLRKKIPMISKEQNVYLAVPELNVRGIVDEILWLKNGNLAPVDYKYSLYKKFAFVTHKIQLCLYGIMIEKTYGKKVERGYIAYIRDSSKTFEIELDASLKQKALLMVNNVLEIISKEKMPKKTSEKARCVDCTYKNMCV
ncbi:MAG: CRISPR-associated protein Cas4 [Candidatus Omnitrophota bacterium]|nr:MAG: CRISPR-associated protein Cas4 [Candidatus Omnitrophota bacterium]